MNAIMGMTTLAKVNIDDPDRIQECLQISASSSHLMSLINDILDMNRIEGDQIMLNRGACLSSRPGEAGRRDHRSTG